MNRATLILTLPLAALLAACDFSSTEVSPPAPTDPVPICGDGVVEGAEQCDDGNTLPDDGCSPSCTIEARRQVSVSLSCSAVTGQPLTAQCSATASSFARWFTFEWDDGQSTAARSQATANHRYAVEGTYLVRVMACEFESADEFCGTDDAPVTVTP